MEGKQEGYEKYVSNQSIIYRIASGISTLAAGLALYLGYRRSYMISALMGLVTLCFTLTLFEIKGKEERTHSSLLKGKAYVPKFICRSGRYITFILFTE